MQYAKGDVRITLTPDELDESRLNQIVTLIKAVAGDTAPTKVPSRDECRYCNIGSKDCPERIQESRAIAVGEW